MTRGSGPAPFEVSPAPELVESLLRDGYDVRLRLTGVSMRPLIRSGSVLTFTRAAQAAIGDIVLTRREDGALVAHRLVDLDEKTVWTRGDSVGQADKPLPRGQLLGCALRVEAPYRLPLRNALVRSMGRLLGRAYPIAVRAYRTILPGKRAEL